MGVKQQHMRKYIITWEMSASSCGCLNAISALSGGWVENHEKPHQNTGLQA